ncbi:MAG: glutaredoxin family protein [Tissierellia bacterium]|nr:glutaredoxin family protein [Tissierellia bacterium]
MSDIIVYSSDSCPYCTSLKDYLKEKNVDFVEKNVSTDIKARTELMEMGHMGVPVTVINGEEIVGFDQDRIDDALNI